MFMLKSRAGRKKEKILILLDGIKYEYNTQKSRACW